MKTLIVGLLATVVSTSAFAAKPNESWTPGLSGSVQLMTGYTNKQSQFNIHHSSINTHLDQSGSNYGKAFVAPMGNLIYTFSDAQQQIFLGTNKSDVALGRFHAEVGIRQQLAEGSTVSLSYIPGLLPKKTWEDPYLINQSRTETDDVIRAVRMQYKKILGSPFSLDMAMGHRFIEQEFSGRSLSSPTKQTLQREGNIYFTEGSYLHYLGRGLMLRGALNYTKIDAKGSAMANNNVGAAVSLIQFLPDASLALTLSYHHANFDAVNPIFNKKQTNQDWGAFLAYEYKAPFAWKNWAWVNLLGYKQQQSNIQFYNEKSLLVSTGMSYSF